MVGRFAQADSIVPDIGFPEAYNRYSYAFDNPINNVDPSGHKACMDFDSNGQCIVDPDWRDPNPYITPLMQDLNALYNELSVKKGPWNNNGKTSFTMAEFLGIFLNWESNGIDKWRDYISEAAGRLIWMKGNDLTPHCSNSACRLGIFEFIAEHCKSYCVDRFNGLLNGTQSPAFALINGVLESIDDIIRKSIQIGTNAMDMDKWQPFNGEGVFQWGNDKEFLKSFTGGKGYLSTNLVEYDASDIGGWFLVMTYNQRACLMNKNKVCYVDP